MDLETLTTIEPPHPDVAERTGSPVPAPTEPGYGRAPRSRRRQLRHDIRHQLGTIVMLSSVIGTEPDADPGIRSRAEQILGEARWMEQLLAAYDAAVDFRDYTPMVEPVRVDRVAAHVVSAFRLTHRTVVSFFADETWATVEDLALWRVLRNLLDNAVRAADEDGHVVVRTYPEADWAVLQVDDDGPGLGRAPAGQASLGLMIVAAFAAQCGGTFHLGDSDLGGCRARVRMPIALWSPDGDEDPHVAP